MSALSPNAYLCTLLQLCYLNISYWLFEAMGVSVLVPDGPGHHHCFDVSCSPNVTVARLFSLKNTPDSATTPGPPRALSKTRRDSGGYGALNSSVSAS